MMKLKTNICNFLTIVLSCLLFLTITSPIKAQNQSNSQQKNEFWRNVQFGGGLGLGIGSGYTNIMVAPSGIYNINPYVSMGLGIQYSYVKQSDLFDSHIYGGSLISLFNPIPEVQLSAELEQLRVNNTFTEATPKIKDNFWNTALFLGAGYRNQNVTIGLRYNILYRESNYVYSQGWMPFVRVYF
ncbi:hypothetical protein FCR2A7T_02340 [Flavobacterium cauense R2A-7]|uniref:Alpha-ketoglutarate decarboxylase n=1 Tax=Flavobacterium cauense R2A-7 TaxID=1341154 RepID=V6S569_9FLAO|nr:hypothetical protein [Flavobacterium cauense]ESU21776.1 hypothetical protein FCR2A7T_02340 [Flavobacterium cauense R2A-7]KGO81008.1 hypothetical protein Q762_10235 [Flavobacterium cauense R2A-7]TWI12923.1 hypothetical protein IP98_01402 [Flavobacterium cauense R2A-7]